MKTSGRKNPVLAELILVILFFSLSSAVLVQVFVKARNMSEISRAETLGLVLAQDWVEQWKYNPQKPREVFLEEYGWENLSTGGEEENFRASVDENMILGTGEGVFEIQAQFSKEEREAGSFCRIRVTVVRNRDGRQIAELKTASYIPGEGGEP